MDQPFITLSMTNMKLLMMKGWRFEPMLANETAVPEKGVMFIIVNLKKYKGKKRSK